MSHSTQSSATVHVMNPKQKNKAKKEEQSKFETAVKKLRENKKKDKKRIIKATSHFCYGKDPQKANSDLGTRKVLPRLCAKDIYDDLKSYIDDEMKFDFCVNKCCYNMAQYHFDMKHQMNLSEQLIHVLQCKAPMEYAKLIEGAMITHLISNKNKDCVLQVNDLRFYIKTISQNALSSAMEPRQNANRISYAPLLLVPITDNILMRIQCDRAGIGYSDLPNHKVNRQCNEVCADNGCIHRMIHIHQDFVKDVYFAFGFKKAPQPNKTRIDVTLMSDKLCVTLLTINGNVFTVEPPNMNDGCPQSYHSADYRYSPMKIIK